MAQTAWLELTTFSSDNSNSGSVAWSTPSNAVTEDSTDTTFAYLDTTPTPKCEYLKGLNVNGLNTTGWSEITQVDVRVRAKHSVSSGTPAPELSRVSLIIGGSLQAEDGSSSNSIGTSYSYLDVNLVSDLPTPAQADASDFGVVVEVDDPATPPYSASIGIDVVLVRFTYSTNAAIPDNVGVADNPIVLCVSGATFVSPPPYPLCHPSILDRYFTEPKITELERRTELNFFRDDVVKLFLCRRFQTIQGTLCVVGLAVGNSLDAYVNHESAQTFRMVDDPVITAPAGIEVEIMAAVTIFGVARKTDREGFVLRVTNDSGPTSFDLEWTRSGHPL